ncbi:MAG TPA: hypothetical protein VHO24_01105 [Opitutaceae bacterium]|nr:hypothetical protein [Opitutaceae bacterium]
MKPHTRSSSEELLDFNRAQIETNRREAEQVRGCFTTHVHQTFIAAGIILTFGVNLLKSDGGWYGLGVAVLTIVLLCLATMDVGCHKFNTANRTIAYQIHLARTIDYGEASGSRSAALNTELRRIDWEEAMFAWRVVQPVIFNFFHVKKRIIGVWRNRFNRPPNTAKLKRAAGEAGAFSAESIRFLWAELLGRWQERFGHKNEVENLAKEVKAKDPAAFAKAFKEYPWHSSEEILLTDEFQGLDGAASAEFYPGTYLQKMLTNLIILLSGCIAILWLCWYKITVASLGYGLVAGLVALAVTYVATIRVINNCSRARILESGLCSIQTSAFVWRMVCLAHVWSRLQTTKKNARSGDNLTQPFEGYTHTLAKLACGDLRSNLHRVHAWMQKMELEILAELPPATLTPVSAGPFQAVIIPPQNGVPIATTSTSLSS